MPKAKKIPNSDISSQLHSLATEQRKLERALRKSQAGELKRLVREFKKSLAASKLTVDAATELLGGTSKKRAKWGKKKVKVERLYETGVTYKKPRGTETWVGGTKGRQPGWLKELIAAGRTYQSLAVKV